MEIFIERPVKVESIWESRQLNLAENAFICYACIDKAFDNFVTDSMWFVSSSVTPRDIGTL